MNYESPDDQFLQRLLNDSPIAPLSPLPLEGDERPDDMLHALLHDHTVAQFLQFPITRRKAIIHQRLVQSQRVRILDDFDLDCLANPDIAHGFQLMDGSFVGRDEMGRQVAKEAREVYYGENEFIMRLEWLCEFHMDQYDYDEPPLPIAPLVRHITVETDLHDGYDYESTEEDCPLYPPDGIGEGKRGNTRDGIWPSGDIVARRTRRRLEDLFLFTNADLITLVLRGDGPLDGMVTRQTIADISSVVMRLINYFGNRFRIEKWPRGQAWGSADLSLFWNKPTELTRRNIIEDRALLEGRMQADVEQWISEGGG